jgi:uncharacterized protein (DUF2345 family)
MRAPRPNINARIPRNDSTENLLNGPGPFLARVVNHLDKKYGGALEVELIKFSSVSNTYETDSQLRVVRYASPFYGVTPLRNNDTNDTYSSTQQSYGFWAVPPDVGAKVLVIFVEGREDQGFWIACVQDDYMNFMIPDPRASTTLTSPETSQGNSGKKLPVGEYNKFLANPNNNYPTSQPKPVNVDFVEKLQEQGLIDDDIRGVTSTSARREAPSNVYGMSTPGPLDKQNGAPRNPRGPDGKQVNSFSSRLGGHSIVMDDGDESILRIGAAESSPKEYVKLTPGSVTTGDPTLPANELFRIRTRTGHQILLHNTEDLIYIGNARGTTWIELTSNGKIDIFSQDSVSLHTQQDLNVTADRDINFFANENINMVAGKELRINSGDKFSLTSGERIAFSSGDSLSLKATSFISAHADTAMSLSSGSDSFSIISGSDLILQSASDLGFVSATSIRAASNGSIQINSSDSVMITSTGSDLNLKSSGNMNIESSSAVHTYGQSLFMSSANSVNLTAGANIFAQSAASFNILSGGKTAIQATGGAVTIDGSSNVEINSGGSAFPATEADNGLGGASEPMETAPESPVPPILALTVSRIPQHEPWLQHENFNPSAYTPDKTRAGTQALDSFVQPFPDTYLSRPGATTFGTTRTSTAYPTGITATGEGTDEDVVVDTLPVGDNVRVAHKFFIDKGLTPEQSAGIVGNLMQESGPSINPTAHNRTGGGKGARGIAQWRNPRIQPFFDRYGKDILEGTFAEQLDYIWWELNEKPDFWGLNALKKATTPTEAATIVENKYERANGHGLTARKQYAASVMRLYLAGYNLESVSGSNIVTDKDGNPVPFEMGEFTDTGNLELRVDEQQHLRARIRRLPLARQVVDILNYAAHASGVSRVEVVSGGQPHRKTGGARKGSFRHDVAQPGARSGGMAADFDLYVAGKRLDGNNPRDREIMARFIAHAVSRGARGIGWDSSGYMGSQRIHIDPWGAGQNNRALCVWGRSQTSATAVPWVVAAAQKGMPK